MQESDYHNLKTEIENFVKAVLDQYKTVHPSLVENDDFKVDFKEDSISVSLFLKEYSYWVEHGRMPSSKFPPLTSIQTWIDSKPILPTQPKLGRVSPNTGYSSLAYLIGRKIKQQGFKGDGKLEEITKSQLKAFMPKFQEALKTDSEDYISEMIPIKIT